MKKKTSSKFLKELFHYNEHEVIDIHSLKESLVRKWKSLYEKSAMDYYSPRPGLKPKKPKNQKKEKHVYGPQLLSESSVNEILDGIDDVIEMMKDYGEDDRMVFVHGHTPSKESISGESRLVFIFPPDYREREGEKCILRFDEPVDYNYSTYEKTKPEYVNLMETKSGMRYYWGHIVIETGDPDDRHNGLQSWNRSEKSYETMDEFVTLRWERDPENESETKKVTWNGNPAFRTPGMQMVSNPRTNQYDPMDRM